MRLMRRKAMTLCAGISEIFRSFLEGREEKAVEYAMDKVRRECDQGWQGIEYKLNTVGSSRETTRLSR